MGRRSRKRREGGNRESTSIADARVELPGGDSLMLRCSMTPKTRQQYAAVLAGSAGSAASTREDAWQRGVEFLFERLVTAWTVAGVEWTGQQDLLLRWRAATPDQRAAVREALRSHLAEWFPEMTAP